MKLISGYKNHSGYLCAAQILGMLTLGLCAPLTFAQTVSPTLVANNLWYANEITGSIPNDSVLNYVQTSGAKLVRIGGHQFDTSMPSPQVMESWILKIRSLGAEPIVQVSQYNSATSYNNRAVAAANMVQYLNITKNLNVKYWSIGNEPWLQMGSPANHDNIAPTVANYIKAISPAMKAVDPTIKIYGPDEAYFMEDVYAQLFTLGSAYDIAGKIPGKNYYYLDGITWHTYPNGISNPATEGAASILSASQKCKALVDSTNASHGRTGTEALIWGIGEYNAPTAAQVHSFENGQMFGQTLGYGMKYSAAFMATWSMFEHSGDRTGTDFSMIDGDTLPRASYYHMEFVGNQMKGTYADGTSTDANLVAYGTINGTTRNVMVMNRSNASKTFTMRLNNTAITGNNVKININAGSAQEYTTSIGANTTLFLIFNGTNLTKSTYSKTHFNARIAPTVTTEILTPPGGTTTTNLPLTNASFTGSATGWSLYSFAPTFDVRDVRYLNNAVRFYTDGNELNWHAQLYQTLDTTAGRSYSFSCDLATTGTNSTQVQLFIEEDVDYTTIASTSCNVAGAGTTRCTTTGTVPTGGDSYDGKFGVRLTSADLNDGWDFTVDNCAATVTQ